MPKLATTATVKTVTEVKIDPRLRKKLLTDMKAYCQLSAERAALDARMDALRGKISDLRDETGETSLNIDGYTTTVVMPIRKVFDEKAFVLNGGDLQVYNNSMKDVPSKPYEKVTAPKASKQAEL